MKKCRCYKFVANSSCNQLYNNLERKTMRKLALRDEILLQIDKAARYIGGEVNAVMKNKEDVDIVLQWHSRMSMKLVCLTSE